MDLEGIMLSKPGGERQIHNFTNMWSKNKAKQNEQKSNRLDTEK